MSGDIAHANRRFDDDLYRVWLRQPENPGRTFEDFNAWLHSFRPSEDDAPDFVARLILSIS
ncbi:MULTISPECIES: hypothetical protein [unclassified Neisseria]|uniref:hypothetical protein n=1 Tax=unclassified Neisseria TaxID=2623750 RepID=UPI001071DC75|nr:MULTISPECIES: hypothetical protein [unclassified Neisseria]MBF0804968.1 hypothetical protein [Neisseria sp. 19428wB4_WF04]TFU39315.1 hypothetical protein E4T99_11750 [Neisseria sp. WF04]